MFANPTKACSKPSPRDVLHPPPSLLSAFFPNQSLASEVRVLSVCQSNKTSQRTRNSRLQPPILRPEINLLGCSLFLMSSIHKNLCSAPKAYNALHPQPPSVPAWLLLPESITWDALPPNVCQSTKTKNLHPTQSSQLSSPPTPLPPSLPSITYDDVLFNVREPIHYTTLHRTKTSPLPSPKPPSFLPSQITYLPPCSSQCPSIHQRLTQKRNQKKKANLSSPNLPPSFRLFLLRPDSITCDDARSSPTPLHRTQTSPLPPSFPSFSLRQSALAPTPDAPETAAV